jgi:hypothetical protein
MRRCLEKMAGSRKQEEGSGRGASKKVIERVRVAQAEKN